MNSTHLFPPFPTAGVNPGMIPSSSSLPARCAWSVSPDDVVAAPDNADGVGVVITGVVDGFAWLDVYGMEFSLKNYCYKRAYIWYILLSFEMYERTISEWNAYT